MTTKAKLYISWIAAVGLIVLVAGLSHWQSTGLPRLLAFLFLAMVLSTQKIRLPGMKGTMSLSFPFILVGIADFGFGETLLLGVSLFPGERGCCRSGQHTEPLRQLGRGALGAAADLSVPFLVSDSCRENRPRSSRRPR